MSYLKSIGVAGSLLLCSVALAEDPAPPRWQKILGPSEGHVPPAFALRDVVWRKDFAAALKQAKATSKPLLVTWRCLPCEQCAEFDEEILEGSERLDPLLHQFITVRLTNADLLDERYFPYRTHQDLDLSWWAYFLSPDGDLYGVFGGKDEVSENTRISEAAFVNNLRRILDHHYDPRRPQWKIDLPTGHASPTSAVPSESNAYRLLKAKQPWLNKPHEQYGSCIHCHQVADMLINESLEAGDFDVKQLTGRWPLPENVGILLDRDDGLLVSKVTAGSPAQAAGVQPGDRLGMAGGVRLFGQADFRGVLHRAGYGDDTIALAWKRGDQILAGNLEVKPGWRETNSSWRKSVYDGVYGPTMGFFPLRGPAAGKGKGLSIRPFMGPQAAKKPVFATGLRPGMEIVAIDGMTKDLPTRELITWFRLNHTAGDVVTYRIRDGRKFRFTLPERE
ncbi:MAG: thioredoxin family protein [Planctomycetaceae bacterium]|nr:thioredoxin family protein [Planctomycetaceae bacterium]